MNATCSLCRDEMRVPRSWKAGEPLVCAECRCQTCGAEPATLCAKCGASCHEPCDERALHHEPEPRPLKTLDNWATRP